MATNKDSQKFVQNFLKGTEEFGSRVWKSIFRHSWPDSARTRSLATMSNVFLHLHPTTIRRASLKVTYTFCLGGLSFFFFLVLTVSGVLLMFYYVPSVTQAYQNIKDLETVVFAGQFLRNMHRWSAHAMVITVFLHMCRVFYTRAYRPPREFNWIVGVLLLVVTFLLSFSGYLLPWDQLAFWAVTVGTNIAKVTPFLGPEAQFLLIGGYEIGQNALIRFYTLHVIALPLIAAVLMAVHFWRVRKDGFSGGL
ncbi:MAG: cytochrome b N-terminal domain-containing protein [Chloroflexi bacterium]|uniref:Cytochrome b N-terminal domain-containing protein n=1 Tax=Candidatus Chlorohelix allophototropha TaxID=3003348 RepID=A0A8T7LRE0_9CHLR|nr:cytochrome b N-terminal domain-containing protein [Chloroflexota bacterium]WJW66449.1 cytochrome b N-terminal domain-containing protein [Chloroflexota bacterium L227-S17]